MKQGRTLMELATELERQNESKHDLVANTTALRMNNLGRINIEDNEHELLPLAHQQIGARVGIPTKYYNRMTEVAPDLLATNVNHWFTRNPENRMVRLMDDKIRAFLSDRYQRRDNYDLMRFVIPTLNEIGGLQITSCEVTEHKMYLKVTTPRVQTEIRLNDVVQAGLVISNSEVGLGAFKVQPLILRLVCMNGMISNDYGISRYHVGRRIEIEDNIQSLFSNETIEADDKAFWLKARDVVAGALKEETFMSIVQKLTDATENPIKIKPVNAVERLQKRFLLNQNETDTVLENLLKESDLTMYGMSNAVTATAKLAELSYDRATELEELGGTIINLNPTEWKELAVA
jgi:hypothetical protein